MTYSLATAIAPLWTLCTPLLHRAAPGAGLAAMATLGLLGSATHCGPMCGPLVMGQVADRLACVPCARMGQAQRLRSGALLPYHAGRIATYAALGAAAGAAGFGLSETMRPLRGALLLAAALALLGVAWQRHTGPRAPAPRRFLALLTPARRLLRPGSLVYGLVLGLLPCGLVYTALLGACASASAAWGALDMAAFGLGTVPLLAALGIAGHVRPIGRAAPLLLAVNAAVLVWAGVAVLAA